VVNPRFAFLRVLSDLERECAGLGGRASLASLSPHSPFAPLCPSPRPLPEASAPAPAPSSALAAVPATSSPTTATTVSAACGTDAQCTNAAPPPPGTVACAVAQPAFAEITLGAIAPRGLYGTVPPHVPEHDGGRGGDGCDRGEDARSRSNEEKEAAVPPSDSLQHCVPSTASTTSPAPPPLVLPSRSPSVLPAASSSITMLQSAPLSHPLSPQPPEVTASPPLAPAPLSAPLTSVPATALGALMNADARPRDMQPLSLLAVASTFVTANSTPGQCALQLASRTDMQGSWQAETCEDESALISLLLEESLLVSGSRPAPPPLPRDGAGVLAAVGDCPGASIHVGEGGEVGGKEAWRSS